jgi:hypothetical protein
MENNRSCSAGSLTDLRILYLYGNSLGTIPVELEALPLWFYLGFPTICLQEQFLFNLEALPVCDGCYFKAIVLAFSPLLQHSKSPSQEHASLH